MCVVSNVHDYMRDRTYPPIQWPQPNTVPGTGDIQIVPEPNTVPMPPGAIIWTRESFDAFKQILEKLAELDAKLKQPDCVDPEKARWMQVVEERLAALERAQKLDHGKLR